MNMEIKIVVPALGESIVEATVGNWLKKAGDPVKVGDPIVELETDKVNLEVAAEQAGVLARVDHNEGEDVRVGDVLGVISTEAASGAGLTARPVEVKEKPDEPPQPETAPTSAEIKKSLAMASEVVAPAPVKGPDEAEEEKATPLAKRIAEDKQIDLRQITGSGTGGRILRKDVVGFAGNNVATEVARTAQTEKLAAVAPGYDETEERVRMSRRRRAIAEKLVEAQHSAAMLTTFNDVDMSAIMKMRQLHKEAFKEKFGVSLGITSFFVKASILALKDFPRLNAEIQGDEMVLKHYYHIGVAVGAEEGLVVPVLHHAERMTFAEIERTIQDYAVRAREGKLTLEEIRGSTFTITNGGVFGSLLSTPILNGPEVGILGLHRIEDRPVAVNGEIVIRPMMYMALSYDHRIVDGREAVQFLVRLKKAIESPELMMLEL
jgi:2-oxoglutarate dehydrogenase E2 component (dihydrolipoamide succinyltransferase)